MSHLFSTQSQKKCSYLYEHCSSQHLSNKNNHNNNNIIKSNTIKLFKRLYHFMCDYFYFPISLHRFIVEHRFYSHFYYWSCFFSCCRKIWSRVYGNPQIKDHYTALLGIPKASRLDEGVYTCQVSNQNVQRTYIYTFMSLNCR